MMIQRATADQAAQLVELGPRIFANAIRAIGPFDRNAWSMEVGRLLVLNDRRAFVALDADRIVGAHVVVAGAGDITPTLTVRTVTLWIHPDARSRGIATRLQSVAETWCRDIGAKLMAAGVPVDYSAHADIGDNGAGQGSAQAFYEGRGYQRAETMFLKEIR